MYVLKSKQMTSTRLHQKSVKSGLRLPCFNRRTGGSGQCSIQGTNRQCAPPRYDAKPVRFALNQGSRKLCSGGVTCPGLIRCAGLEQYHEFSTPFLQRPGGFARMLHFKFQTSLTFTHSAFLKGQSSNQFNSIQIYSRNGTRLILIK